MKLYENIDFRVQFFHSCKMRSDGGVGQPTVLRPAPESTERTQREPRGRLDRQHLGRHAVYLRCTSRHLEVQHGRLAASRQLIRSMVTVYCGKISCHLEVNNLHVP